MALLLAAQHRAVAHGVLERTGSRRVARLAPCQARIILACPHAVHHLTCGCTNRELYHASTGCMPICYDVCAPSTGSHITIPRLQVKDVMAHLYFKAKESFAQQAPKEVGGRVLCAMASCVQPSGSKRKAATRLLLRGVSFGLLPGGAQQVSSITQRTACPLNRI